VEERFPLWKGGKGFVVHGEKKEAIVNLFEKISSPV
jgi:hypothetical protein